MTDSGESHLGQVLKCLLETGIMCPTRGVRTDTHDNDFTFIVECLTSTKCDELFKSVRTFVLEQTIVHVWFKFVMTEVTTHLSLGKFRRSERRFHVPSLFFFGT